MTRRTLLKHSIVFTAAALLPAKGMLWEPYRLSVTRHEVTLQGLPKKLQGLRVVQLSDIHKGTFVSSGFLRRVAERVMALRPDVILMTGDFVYHSHLEIDPCMEAISSLRAPFGVFSVLGNHDHWTSPQYITERLEAAGYPVLVNRSREVSRGLWVAGVDDLWSGNADPAAALSDVPDGAAAILMSHNAELLDHVSRPLLLLAGHTHGRQVNLGRLSDLIVGSITSGGRYVSGWYSNGGARMYINRGIGTIGIPARFRSTPEISVFHLAA